MPEKEGLETIHALRKDYPDIKVIAISGGGTIDAQRYLSIAELIGAQHILSKPFSTKELLAAVNDLLD